MGPKKGGSKPKGKEEASSDASGSKGKVKAAQSINVRHILCAKMSKKDEALAALREGKKFDEVAREFSEDKQRSGGSLGWQTKGSLEPAFEKVAFELEASTTAKPTYAECKTGHGYHIIMVEGRK